MTIKRLAGTIAVLTLTIGSVFAMASPAHAEDDHFPAAGWQVRDIALGDTVWSDAAASAIVDEFTVELTKPVGTTGTSIETGDLGLTVTAGDAIAVSYALEDGADLAAGAIRMFYYDTAGADTLLVAPTAFAVADGTGTLVIVVAADATIGTLGLTYDASNTATGTVRFTNLVVGDTSVLFEERPVVEPTEPTEEPTADPVAVDGEQLPVTGRRWLLPAVGGGLVAIVAGIGIYLAARRPKPVRFTA